MRADEVAFVFAVVGVRAGGGVVAAVGVADGGGACEPGHCCGSQECFFEIGKSSGN